MSAFLWTYVKNKGPLILFTLIALTTDRALADANVCVSSVQHQLRKVMGASIRVQESFVSRRESSIVESLTSVLQQIECVYKVSHAMKFHDRRHLVTMLSGVKEAAARTRLTRGETRENHARDFFRQSAHMAQFYNLIGASHEVFFCDVDKTFWLQVGSRPRNPLHPELASCGYRVPALATAANSAGVE